MAGGTVGHSWLILVMTGCAGIGGGQCLRFAMQQLYEDLLFHYVPEVRPSEQPNDVTLVYFTSFLIQILDLNEKDQLFKTNLWLELEWTDYRLTWDPQRYDNITSLHIPACKIWIPDIVVYNNAAGAPQITILTDVFVTHEGRIIWKPPFLGNSFCAVNIAKFPYDEQLCHMKFGTWSYDAKYVDLEILRMYETPMIGTNSSIKDIGMDLSYYYRSAEWDILNVSAVRHEKVYAGCCGRVKYVDVTFNFHLRRLPLFYSANMMLPCGLIGVLSMLAYMLPADSKQRMTLCISILVSLSVFFLLLVEIMPATSAGIPIMGKYILFNMISISTTIAITTVTLNLHHRSSDFPLSPLMRWLIIEKVGSYINVVNPKVVNSQANRSSIHIKKQKSTSSCSPRPHKPSSRSSLLRTASIKTSSNWLAEGDVISSDDTCSLASSGSDVFNKWPLPRSATDSGVAGGPQPMAAPHSTPCGTASAPRHNSHAELTTANRPCTQKARQAAFIGCSQQRNQQQQQQQLQQPQPYRRDASFNDKSFSTTDLSSSSLASVAPPAEPIDPRQEIILKTVNNVIYIGESYRMNAIKDEISQDWSMLAMVIDRVCLWIYTILTFCVNAWFIVQLPYLWDQRQPLGTPAPTSPLGYAAAKQTGSRATPWMRTTTMSDNDVLY